MAATAQSIVKIGILEILSQLQFKYGLIVLVLVLLLAFVCFLFWKMTWNVWSKAMDGKDQEIQRMLLERNEYRALVFARLKSSEADATVPKSRGESGKK
jgi:hypothetical protein